MGAVLTYKVSLIWPVIVGRPQKSLVWLREYIALPPYTVGSLLGEDNCAYLACIANAIKMALLPLSLFVQL